MDSLLAEPTKAYLKESLNALGKGIKELDKAYELAKFPEYARVLYPFRKTLPT